MQCSRFNIHHLPQFQGTNTALAAVALQDHLMRNLSLRDPLLLNRQKAPQPKAKQWRKDARPTIDTGRGKRKKYHTFLEISYGNQIPLLSENSVTFIFIHIHHNFRQPPFFTVKKLFQCN